MNVLAPTKGHAWPADLLASATEHKIEDCLQPILDMTQRLFPAARAVRVFLEEDAELADFKFVVYAVQVPGLGPARLADDQKRWVEEMLRLCPTPRHNPFVLSLDCR